MKKQNGVTMISLIITIIVMVILAGVAISMVVGEDAVITKSKAGVSSSNLSQAQEEVNTAWGDLEMGFWMDTNTVKRSEYFTAENLQNALGVGEIKDFIYNPGGVTTGIYVKDNEEYEFSIDTSNHTDVTTNDFGTTTGGYGEGAGTNDNINNNTTVENALSGVWKFNETIDMSFDLAQEINYTSNGVDYVVMHMSYNGESDQLIVYYKNSADNDPLNPYEWVTVWDNSNQWSSDVYRTLDFGTTLQEVPEEFYNWFTANATKQ